MYSAEWEGKVALGPEHAALHPEVQVSDNCSSDRGSGMDTKLRDEVGICAF